MQEEAMQDKAIPWHEKEARDREKQINLTEVQQEKLTHQHKMQAREQEIECQSWHCQTTKSLKQWPDVRRNQESMREWQLSQTEVQEEESTHWFKKQVSWQQIARLELK